MDSPLNIDKRSCIQGVWHVYKLYMWVCISMVTAFAATSIMLCSLHQTRTTSSYWQISVMCQDVFYKKCCISIDTSVYRNMYPVKLMLNVVPIWLCVALQLTSFPIWELFLMWILPILFLEHNEKINLPIRSFGFLQTQTSIIIIHWWRLNTIGYKLYVMTRYCFQL